LPGPGIQWGILSDTRVFRTEVPGTLRVSIEEVRRSPHLRGRLLNTYKPATTRESHVQDRVKGEEERGRGERKISVDCVGASTGGREPKRTGTRMDSENLLGRISRTRGGLRVRPV
jgi:hypothetical protein